MLIQWSNGSKNSCWTQRFFSEPFWTKPQTNRETMCISCWEVGELDEPFLQNISSWQCKICASQQLEPQDDGSYLEWGRFHCALCQSSDAVDTPDRVRVTDMVDKVHHWCGHIAWVTPAHCAFKLCTWHNFEVFSRMRQTGESEALKKSFSNFGIFLAMNPTVHKCAWTVTYVRILTKGHELPLN